MENKIKEMEKIIEEKDKKIEKFSKLIKTKDEKIEEINNNIINLNKEFNKKLEKKDEELKRIKNEMELKKEEYENKIKQNILKQFKEKDSQLNMKEEKEINKRNIKILEKEKEINKAGHILEEKKKLDANERKQLENSIIENKRKNQSINEFVEKNKNLEKGNENIKLNNLNLNKEIVSIEKNNRNLMDEYEKIKQNYQNLMKENENIKQNYQNLMNENEKIKQNYQNLMNENEKIKQNYQNLIKDNENIKQKDENLINEIENIKQNNQNLINEKELIKNKNEQLKNEYEKMKQKNKIFKKEIKDLKEKINQNQRKFNEISSNIKENKIHKNLSRSVIGQNQLDFDEINKKNIGRNNSMSSRENKDPIKLYDYPTLIGLNNLGATCFMNSTLQCLSQTKALANYFLRESSENKIFYNNIAKTSPNELQLSPVFYDLIKNLWSQKGIKSFSPDNFMDRVEKMNSIFKTGQAGDSKDFIIFILEQLHKELKEPVKSIKNNINIIRQLDQYDKNNAFQFFFQEFKKECSVISDIFFGFSETTNICINCKNNYSIMGLNNPICYNYQIFNCLIFPLEEIKKIKNNSNQQFNYGNYIMNQNNSVSIYDCFCYYQKSELFTGQNMNFCNKCRQLNNSIYTSQIFVSPNVLVLILNRGKGNIYNVKLNFLETIDITEFILQKEKPQITYNLYGVITHIGESGPNAHFIASCKSPVDNNWYKYNDAIVSPIKNIKKEVIDFGTPYILFYQKNK